jgi:hypothetical protein
MSDTGVQPVAAAAPEGAGLTQWQRVAFTFSAPSKTFEDIKRGNKSWWLPLILVGLVSYSFFDVVVQKVGIRQVTENQIRISPKAQERMAQATPEQKEQGYKLSDGITEFFFAAGPLVGMIGALVVSAVLLATINFGFGGRAKFTHIFAMSYYAWLPTLVKLFLGIVVIYAGMAPESFNIKNFSPTNLGAFLDPADTNPALYSIASSLDLVSIWITVLMGIGLSTLAGVKRSAGYIAVFGWWLICVIFGAGVAAVFS